MTAMSDETARLYLLTPPLAEAAAFAPLLAAALDAGDVACVLLQFATQEAAAVRKTAQILAEIAQARGAALLIGADPSVSIPSQADGVHVRGGGTLLNGLLKTVKPDRIVGVGGLKTRDEAMDVGESDVDYLMFGEPTGDGFVPPVSQTIERVAWWAEIFNVPCVAYAHRLPDVAALSATGADFIALGEAIWNDPRGPAAAVHEAQMLLQPLPVR